MQNEKGHTTISPIPSEELYRFGADGNLRMYSYDRLFYSLYGYNAGTTRTYKYSMDLSPNWVNGRLENVNFNLHTAMFYPNSYLNFNQDGYYTKHYYNGMERIASRLGDNNLLLATHDPELQDRKWQLDSNIRRNIVGITGYEFLPVGEEQTIDDPKPIFELPVIGISNLQPSSDGIYYYHPNHLGSTCYVTNENATVQQGFLYAPFGEITNEHNSSFGNGVIPKYSFNAKELDEETGMYYYEARYMAPPVFISRDPLFEKYPTFSPYAYCVNNPVNVIDPTGMECNPVFGMDGIFRGCTKEGYTGTIIIFDGEDDFSALSATDLIESTSNCDKSAAYYSRDISLKMSDQAKIQMYTHILGTADGTIVNDAVFCVEDMTLIYNSNGAGNWTTRMNNGGEKQFILTATDKYIYQLRKFYDDGAEGYVISGAYEATVENIIATVVYHEWFGHYICKYSSNNKHYKCYQFSKESPYYENTTELYKEYIENHIIKNNR